MRKQRRFIALTWIQTLADSHWLETKDSHWIENKEFHWLNKNVLNKNVLKRIKIVFVFYQLLEFLLELIYIEN